MEIPEDAWKEDPNGIALAKCVNSYLPDNIRVFSILPSQKWEPEFVYLDFCFSILHKYFISERPFFSVSSPFLGVSILEGNVISGNIPTFYQLKSLE